MSATALIRLALMPPAARYHELLRTAFAQMMSLERYLARTDIATLTAWHGDELVGVSLFGAVQLDDAPALLSMYSYVCPPWRGQGLNRRFKGFVEQEAVRRGMARAMAHVRAGNLASVRSLERAGYRRHGTEPLYYADGEPKLRMVKVLACEDAVLEETG